MSGYRTVIVGTDGSDSSMRAVERAGAFAAQENAKLIVATAPFTAIRKGRVVKAAFHPTKWVIVAPRMPSDTTATGCTVMRVFTKSFMMPVIAPGLQAPGTSKSGQSSVLPFTR